MSDNFMVQLASDAERPGLVAEILFEQQLVAVVTADRGDKESFRVQLYPSSQGTHWDLPGRAFMDAIGSAKRALAEPRPA